MAHGGLRKQDLYAAGEQGARKADEPSAAEQEASGHEEEQVAVAFIDESPFKRQPLALEDIQAIIISLLGSLPVTPEALYEGFEAHEQYHDVHDTGQREQFHLALLELELSGRIHKSADGQICLLR